MNRGLTEPNHVFDGFGGQRLELIEGGPCEFGLFKICQSDKSAPRSPTQITPTCRAQSCLIQQLEGLILSVVQLSYLSCSEKCSRSKRVLRGQVAGKTTSLAFRFRPTTLAECEFDLCQRDNVFAGNRALGDRNPLL